MENITEHAYQRLKERVGIKGKKQAEEFVSRIWETGKKIEDIADRKECLYLLHICDAGGSDREIRIHGNYVYIFTKGGVFLTVVINKHRTQKKPPKSRSCFVSQCYAMG